MKTPAPERAAGRKALAAKDQALPDGTDPIPNLAYLKKAIRSIGRVAPAKRAAVKALIIKRARELGALKTKGVKGTWAFQGANIGGAINLATTRNLPVVRGPADIQLSRPSPGVVGVMHKSTGMKIGSLAVNDSKWSGTHAPSKTKIPAAPNVSTALAGLIAVHNQMASPSVKKLPAAQQGGTAVLTAEPGDAIDLAGALPMSTPASSSSDGPRVTMTAGVGNKKKVTAKPAVTKAASKLGLSAEATVVYAKLIKKGMSPKAALGFAKRAAAMHAKDAKPAAAKAA